MVPPDTGTPAVVMACAPCGVALKTTLPQSTVAGIVCDCGLDLILLTATGLWGTIPGLGGGATFRSVVVRKPVFTLDV